jgi:hypothetical protein
MSPSLFGAISIDFRENPPDPISSQSLDVGGVPLEPVDELELVDVEEPPFESATLASPAFDSPLFDSVPPLFALASPLLAASPPTPLRA